MDESQSAQAATAGSQAAPIGQFDARGSADHDVFDVARAVKEDADLATDFRRKLGHGPRQIIGDQAIFFDPPAPQAFESFGLACFEAVGIAVNWN